MFRFIKVALGYFHGYTLNFKCNGVLISEHFVLSVAHCLKPDDSPVIRLGSVSTKFVQKNYRCWINTIKTKKLWIILDIYTQLSKYECCVLFNLTVTAIIIWLPSFSCSNKCKNYKNLTNKLLVSIFNKAFPCFLFNFTGNHTTSILLSTSEKKWYCIDPTCGPGLLYKCRSTGMSWNRRKWYGSNYEANWD